MSRRIMIQKYAIGKVTSQKEPATATVSANSNVQKNALLSQLRDHLKCVFTFEQQSHTRSDLFTMTHY